MSEGPHNTIVLVMGLTGAGKSTFIERLTGLPAGIGHDLKSETSRMTAYPYEYGDRRVYLVDAPGFDDSRCMDSEILTEIAFYLSQIHKSNFRLGGILYLHRITDNRVSASAMRSFQIVQSICGPRGAKFARLVTTMWDEAPESSDIYKLAVKRETELESVVGYWGWMSSHGSKIQRCLDTRASVLSILASLLAVSDAQGPVVFQLQEEIVDQQKGFDDTAAGIILNEHYGTKWDRLQGELRALQTSITESSTKQSSQQLQEQKLDLERQMKAAEIGERGLRQEVESLFADKTEQHQVLLFQTEEEISELSSNIASLKSELQTFREDSNSNTPASERQTRAPKRPPHKRIQAEPQSMPEERSAPSGPRGGTGLHVPGRRLQKKNKPEYLLEAMSEDERREYLEKKLAHQEKVKIVKRNTLAISGMLAGGATIAAGAVTMQIPVVAAGIALFGSLSHRRDHKETLRRAAEASSVTRVDGVVVEHVNSTVASIAETRLGETIAGAALAGSIIIGVSLCGNRRRNGLGLSYTIGESDGDILVHLTIGEGVRSPGKNSAVDGLGERLIDGSLSGSRGLGGGVDLGWVFGVGLALVVDQGSSGNVLLSGDGG
ncbi:hypothetical protein HG530_011831 [Fusarium avenaceum]|nr:hypothetical protein HG530_011831 [Fusarium avenaceum]